MGESEIKWWLREQHKSRQIRRTEKMVVSVMFWEASPFRLLGSFKAQRYFVKTIRGAFYFKTRCLDDKSSLVTVVKKYDSILSLFFFYPDIHSRPLRIPQRNGAQSLTGTKNTSPSESHLTVIYDASFIHSQQRKIQHWRMNDITQKRTMKQMMSFLVWNTMQKIASLVDLWQR